MPEETRVSTEVIIKYQASTLLRGGVIDHRRCQQYGIRVIIYGHQSSLRVFLWLCHINAATHLRFVVLDDATTDQSMGFEVEATTITSSHIICNDTVTHMGKARHYSGSTVHVGSHRAITGRCTVGIAVDDKQAIEHRTVFLRCEC